MADVTFYPGPDTRAKLGWPNCPPEEEHKHANKRKARSSLDLLVSFEGDPLDKLRRAVVCGCYAGHHCSVTVRETELLTKAMETPPLQIPLPDTSKYAPQTSLHSWPTDIVTPWREENATFVNVLWDLIDRADIPTHGVIAVAGATGSHKSTYAKEIARRHISRLLAQPGKGDGRPHVVTYEDPIESWFAYSPEAANQAGFDYTPRQKDIDVKDLAAAVTDALRQKPALLYVNEARNAIDWRRLLFFAGTGHLAITTTHAGSLVEAFEQIFVAAKANTPDKRSRIASRIVAMVHVREVDGSPVPAMWLQTPRSRIGLTQEGLASLLPNGAGCFGRAFFAKALKRCPQTVKAALKCDLGGE